jgi:hypothetical protein
MLILEIKPTYIISEGKCYHAFNYIKSYADNGTRTNILYFRMLLLASDQLAGLGLLAVRAEGPFASPSLAKQTASLLAVRAEGPFASTSLATQTTSLLAVRAESPFASPVPCITNS